MVGANVPAAVVKDGADCAEAMASPSTKKRTSFLVIRRNLPKDECRTCEPLNVCEQNGAASRKIEEAALRENRSGLSIMRSRRARRCDTRLAITNT